MAKTIKPEPGVERACLLGVGECSEAEDVRTLQGKRVNPYSYGTPCYWVWHGANFGAEYFASSIDGG